MPSRCRHLQILYENPDALTAGYTSADVQGLLDIDETTAAWINQTLARRLPSFSAARRRQDVNKDKLRRVLQRQSSMDKVWHRAVWVSCAVACGSSQAPRGLVSCSGIVGR